MYRLAPFALMLLLALGCQPDEPVEWLHREDSIIVQMRTAGGDFFLRTSDQQRLPAFTLYGDGTLIVSETKTNSCGQTPYDDCFASLLESHLSEDDTQELIDFIDGTGFFNFEYEQPIPPVQGAGTTYVYVNTKLAANAVRAEALGWDGDDSAEWLEFRKLGTIRDRIGELKEAAVETSTPFDPDEAVLQVIPRVATDFIGVPLWPYPEIALPVTGELNEISHVQLTAAQIESMALDRPNETMCWERVQSGERLYEVCYRPALPFEENFPEFDEAR
jgi:hypothetical protein